MRIAFLFLIFFEGTVIAEVPYVSLTNKTDYVVP